MILSPANPGPRVRLLANSVLSGWTSQSDAWGCRSFTRRPNLLFTKRSDGHPDPDSLHLPLVYATHSLAVGHSFNFEVTSVVSQDDGVSDIHSMTIGLSACDPVNVIRKANNDPDPERIRHLCLCHRSQCGQDHLFFDVEDVRTAGTEVRIERTMDGMVIEFNGRTHSVHDVEHIIGMNAFPFILLNGYVRSVRVVDPPVVPPLGPPAGPAPEPMLIVLDEDEDEGEPVIHLSDDEDGGEAGVAAPITPPPTPPLAVPASDPPAPCPAHVMAPLPSPPPPPVSPEPTAPCPAPQPAAPCPASDPVDEEVEQRLSSPTPTTSASVTCEPNDAIVSSLPQSPVLQPEVTQPAETSAPPSPVDEVTAPAASPDDSDDGDDLMRRLGLASSPEPEPETENPIPEPLVEPVDLSIPFRHYTGPIPTPRRACRSRGQKPVTQKRASDPLPESRVKKKRIKTRSISSSPLSAKQGSIRQVVEQMPGVWSDHLPDILDLMMQEFELKDKKTMSDNGQAIVRSLECVLSYSRKGAYASIADMESALRKIFDKRLKSFPSPDRRSEQEEQELQHFSDFWERLQSGFRAARVSSSLDPKLVMQAIVNCEKLATSSHSLPLCTVTSDRPQTPLTPSRGRTAVATVTSPSASSASPTRKRVRFRDYEEDESTSPEPDDDSDDSYSPSSTPKKARGRGKERAVNGQFKKRGPGRPAKAKKKKQKPAAKKKKEKKDFSHLSPIRLDMKWFSQFVPFDSQPDKQPDAPAVELPLHEFLGKDFGMIFVPGIHF